MDTEFVPFPKMARWSREVIVTEKLDGTNAQVIVSDDGLTLRAASRTRFITPQDDNYGFAKWVEANTPELLKLGPGRHYGEWWGQGIQRGYGLKEKRFSLFNVERWSDDAVRPSVCGVVPVLWRGNMDWLDMEIHGILSYLTFNGSKAAPGFMDPEGIVIYHVAAGVGFKKTLKNDESPKSMVK